MIRERIAAVLALLLVLSAWFIRSVPDRGDLLRRAPAPRVFLVENLSLEQARSVGVVVGVLPSRAGRTGEAWSFEDVIRTGSRSPVPPGAPRWGGPLERIASLEDARVSSPDETLVFIGLPASPDIPALVPVVLARRGEPSLLTSASTRYQPGLIAATDLASFLEGRSLGAGQPLRSLSAGPELSEKVALWESQHRAMRFLKGVPWVLAALLGLGAWRRGTHVALFGALYPFGLLLVPALGVRGGWIYLIAALAAGGLAALGPRGLKIAAWGTVFLLTGDALTSGWVLMRTPLSYSPLEAARFYGVGNEAGGYLIGLALIAAGSDIFCLATLGTATALLLGAPMLGANFGCFLAALVGSGVGIFVRVKRERRAFVAAVFVALFVALTLLLARGSAGTHLGRAASGAGEGRGTVVARKLAMNARLSVTSPWALLLLLQGVLLWRNRKSEKADAGILAGAGAAWLLNDSGVVAAALCLLAAIGQQRQTKAAPPGGEAA